MNHQRDNTYSRHGSHRPRLTALTAHSARSYAVLINDADEATSGADPAESPAEACPASPPWQGNGVDIRVSSDPAPLDLGHVGSARLGAHAGVLRVENRGEDHGTASRCAS